MIATVDGQPVPTNALWSPAMNFNQFRWDFPLGEYTLQIGRKAFVDALGPAFATCREELIADEPNDPDGAPYLREIGYPPVFLYENVFEAFLPGRSSSATFMINSVDAVTASGSVVVIRGRGYHVAAHLPS
jgi:hypothetical protein